MAVAPQLRKQIPGYEAFIELENVLIGSMDQTIHEGNVLHDSIGLKYSRVKWKYTQQKIGGGAGGNTAGGWDLSTNRIV